MSEKDDLVILFNIIDQEKINYKIQLEIVMMDIIKGKVAIRTRYADQFFYIRKQFRDTIKRVMNIKIFDNIISFYLLNLIDFNKILYYNNIEILSMSNYISKIIPHNYTHISCIPLMTDVIFEKLQEHIEQNNNRADTEVYSICRPFTYRGEPITVKKEPSGSRISKDQLEKIDENTNNRLADYKIKMGNIKNNAVDYIKEEQEEKIVIDIKLSIDLNVDRYGKHIVPKTGSESSNWRVRPPKSGGGIKDCDNCKAVCEFPNKSLNIPPLKLIDEYKRMEPSMGFVLNVEKHFNGDDQRFTVSSCRSKFVGGNGRFIPIKEPIDHISFEQPIDILIREMMEEWCLNYNKLRDLFTREKITLLDRNYHIINVYYKTGVISGDNEINIFKIGERSWLDEDESHVSLSKCESYKDDEFIFVCKFDIDEKDLEELFKPNKEVPKSVGGKQYRSYWRHILTDIFKL